ncbi:hypothetical protein CKO09_02220 [Chromatium weissei]|nr:hypothetical protein [Chromatium weissei]
MKELLTPLAQMISIRAEFGRSINLARDRDSIELLRSYIPTFRAVTVLEQIADGLSSASIGRALALIGPYGAGKSAFALFTAALLAAPSSSIHRTAFAILRQQQPSLAERFRTWLGTSEGILRVQINGIPDSLIRQIMLALALAAEQAGLAATFVQRLRAAARPEVRMDHVLDLVSQVQSAWAEVGGIGVLIEIDELGKFLEFEAYNPQHREIHLLQLLAEKSAESGSTPLFLLVMLHQAFEHYSNRLGKSLRDEWKKVQGRFSAIAFLEPAEQALPVIAAAFQREGTLTSAVETDIRSAATELMQCAALPHGIDLARAIKLFTSCYPLHPLTLLILPVLCQKVAQNERTLFSYLGSTDSFGLRGRLESLHLGDWIGPWELYDYFILNQASGFSDPLSYHRWVEVITALERYDGDTSSGSTDSVTRLLKTIGLLNLIGAQRGLKASDTLLRLLFGDDLNASLDILRTASIVHFRSYSQEFRVWQGSDFDLHSALQQAAAEQATRPLAETLNNLAPLTPLVARRASIETGTLRRFEPFFTSADCWPPKSNSVELPLWLYLAEPEEIPDLRKTGSRAVVGVCRFTERLREAVTEWLALQELPRQHAVLQQDPIAQREHRAWLENAENEANSAIRTLLEAPETLSWFFGGKHRDICDRSAFQRELSRWVQKVCFPQAPLLRNELINRERPSTAANIGRKKLLAAMLKTPEQEGLGIEKTPAEKSLYLSLLHESGLHRADSSGRWNYFPPPPIDRCNLRPLWNAISSTLGDVGERQVSLTELYAKLQAPPFGVRLGVLPILVITYLLANRREVALYQEGVFRETLTIEQAELLCRRPALFALERFELVGLRGELFEQYLGSIVGNLQENATLLDIVRPLIRFASKLPDYSQHCAGLSLNAERVRTAFRQAKSPGVLLFDALPRACGIDPETLANNDQSTVERFIAGLIAVLRELNTAYPALLTHWQTQLQHAMLNASIEDLTLIRSALAQRYQGLDRYASQQGTVGAFIRRLSDTHFETDQAWLESVMTLLGHAPPAKWRESHRAHAELRLMEMAKQLRELEQLCHVMPEARANESNGDAAVMVKLVEAAQGEITRVVRITSLQRAAAEQAATRIAEEINALDDATQVAVIAALLKRLAQESCAGNCQHD